MNEYILSSIRDTFNLLQWSLYLRVLTVLDKGVPILILSTRLSTLREIRGFEGRRILCSRGYLLECLESRSTSSLVGRNQTKGFTRREEPMGQQIEGFIVSLLVQYGVRRGGSGTSFSLIFTCGMDRQKTFSMFQTNNRYEERLRVYFSGL